MTEKPQKLQLTMETIRMLDALAEKDLQALITHKQPTAFSHEDCAQRRPNWSFESCPDTIGACRSILC